MGQVDYKELKKSGFMAQTQKNYFVLRVKILGGQVAAKKLKRVYEIAENYGRGYIHMTSRQSIEIPFIRPSDIDEVKKAMAAGGLCPGACGACVRTITACQGSVVCPNGLIDTTDLALEFEERYYARELPHKFKIGITGCRNNCLKAEGNDLGVKGGMKPEWVDNKCSFCGLCERVCPAKAIRVCQEDRSLTYDESTCVYCGRCVKSCPVQAWRGTSGFLVYLGGLFGNRITIGKQLLPIIFSKEELHRVIETTLEFFKKYGKAGERFCNTLDRVGWDLLEQDLQKKVQKV